jgi:hypothetical protein
MFYKVCTIESEYAERLGAMHAVRAQFQASKAQHQEFHESATAQLRTLGDQVLHN